MRTLKSEVTSESTSRILPRNLNATAPSSHSKNFSVTHWPPALPSSGLGGDKYPSARE